MNVLRNSMKLCGEALRPLLRLGRFLRRSDGTAAVEMALWTAVIIVPMASVFDIGEYTYRKMQVENAAEMAVQAAWHACDPSELPAVQNCTGLANTGLLATLRTAAQSTSLGTNVTIAATTTAVTEGYYCTNNGTGALVLVGTEGHLSPTAVAPVAPSPNDCHTVVGTGTPGDYIQVTVSYTYSPLFSGLSIASFLPTPITKQAWMRLK